MSTQLSKATIALNYARHGFRIFPLVPNGKTPANEGNWRKTASSDPQRVHDMWTCPVLGAEQDYNIGIALDRNTLVVDIDVRDGKQGKESLEFVEAIYEPLPPTLTIGTPTGGEHRYYRVEDSSSFAKTLATDIDLKGEGGYVVAAGSTIDGKPYRLLNAVDLAQAPSWIGERAPRKSKTRDAIGRTDAIVDLDTPAAIARATEWLTTKAPDSGTYAVAAKVKDFGVSQEKCLELVLDHWPPAEGKDDDHVAFRVANAYRYGQNAPGIASAEAEFDAVEVEERPAPKRKGLYVIRWADAKPVLDQPYLIDGVMDLGTMVVTYGDSNAGKTYVKLDQCFHIAAGRLWNGHKVRQGLIVYVAAEGGTGFLKRMEAFKRHYGVTELPFSLVPCPIDLFDGAADTAKLIKLVRAEEEHYGQKCVMVVIDTLARAMGSGDENTAKDMGVFVGHVDRVRAATGATVDIIHHTGKDKAKGARGSSALRAATDTELEVQPGVLSVAKQRDLARCDNMKFELLSIEVGQREDGEPITACVVRWVSSAETEFEAKLTPPQEEALAVLDTLIAEREAAGNTTNPTIVKFTAWCGALKIARAAKGIKGGQNPALGRAIPVLIENGLVAKTKDNQYVRTVRR